MDSLEGPWGSASASKKLWCWAESNFPALCFDLENAKDSAGVDGVNNGAGAAAVSRRRLAVDAATAPMKDLKEDFSFFVGEATMVTVMHW